MTSDVRGYLTIDALEHPPVVIVSFKGDVPSELWLRVLAEWGAYGQNPANTTEVPRERFLSRTAWLVQACRRSTIGIEWNSLARHLMVAGHQDRTSLQDALSSPDLTANLGLLTSSESRFNASLYSFQSRDLGRLAALAHGANFSVPGSGKTLVTLGLYEMERLSQRADRLLVISPMSAFDAWTTEIQRWLSPAPNVQLVHGNRRLRDEIIIINYQLLDSLMPQLTDWITQGNTHLVLDEAHRIKKGWAGQWGQLCLRLAHLAKRRDILTGTPAPQHPRDLVALIEFLWPRWGQRVLPSGALIPKPTSDAVTQAGRAIRPLFVRTTKTELGIPKPTIRTHRVEMGTLQRAIYGAMTLRLRDSFSLTATHRVAMARLGKIVMYLLEAATNPALLPAGSSPNDPIVFHHPPLDLRIESNLYELLRTYTQYELPSKFVELSKMVETNASSGRKSIIWSNFVRNIDYLGKRHLSGLSPAIIHGGVGYFPTSDGSRNRVEELDRFRNDAACMVLVANPAAMGEGVSLHDVCHDAIYLDRTFNAGQYLQSLDRIHRLGLTPDVETRITILVSTGTIDEVVENRVAEKSKRLESLMDDPELTAFALPDDEAFAQPIEYGRDVEVLFAHLRGEHT